MNTLASNQVEWIELDTNEMIEADGGWVAPVIGGIAIYILAEDWSNFKKGLWAGLNAN